MIAIVLAWLLSALWGACRQYAVLAYEEVPYDGPSWAFNSAATLALRRSLPLRGVGLWNLDSRPRQFALSQGTRTARISSPPTRRGHLERNARPISRTL